MDKPQTATSITFVVGGFFVQFNHMSDWMKNKKIPEIILSVNIFVSFTVTSKMRE